MHGGTQLVLIAPHVYISSDQITGQTKREQSSAESIKFHWQLSLARICLRNLSGFANNMMTMGVSNQQLSTLKKLKTNLNMGSYTGYTEKMCF
jgi:hypothetical protein